MCLLMKILIKNYWALFVRHKFDICEFQIELKMFNRMFKSKEINSNNSVFQTKLDYIKKSEIKDGFLLLSKILKLLLTMHTNTASYERSFSCLRKLKIYLRTTMG